MAAEDTAKRGLVSKAHKQLNIENQRDCFKNKQKDPNRQFPKENTKTVSTPVKNAQHHESPQRGRSRPQDATAHRSEELSPKSLQATGTRGDGGKQPSATGTRGTGKRTLSNRHRRGRGREPSATGIGGDGGKQPLSTVVRNVNQCSRCGKQYGGSSKNRNQSYHMIRQFYCWVYIQRKQKH